jgi:hypothetical protein
VGSTPAVRTTFLSVKIFDAEFLFASLIWGSVGFGYFIYGRKQQETVPLIAGLSMIAASYVVGSAMLMSIVSLALMTGVYLIMRQR